MMAFFPILLLFIPIVASLLIYLFRGVKVTILVFVSQIALSVVAVLYALHLSTNPSDALLVFGGWDERIGISFYNDNLSLTFIFLTIIMWWIVLMYVFKHGKYDNKFIFFLTFLQGIFLGIIQTNDLFNMFVFIELTTVLVAILIAYRKTGPAFRAAIYYLLLNTVGALFFLVGVIMLYNVYGVINIRMIASVIDLHSDSTIVRLSYVMMISGISVKAALFPLFTWLPKAHGVAQSGISALLSGLIVKGALYAFIRINNTMFAGASYQTGELFFYIGLTTALVGVLFAMSQKEMKQILAYHTVSQVGIMMMGLSSLNENAFNGGLFHILNHAFFKSLLFLCAGIIIHTYQAKKVGEVRGLLKTMPLLSITMIIAMLSISGAPFFNGFISKSMVKYAMKGDWIQESLFFLVNLGTATSFIKFSQVFFGPKQMVEKEKNPLQYASLIVLALLCLGIGIFYQPLSQILFQVDLSSISLWKIQNFFDYFVFVGVGFMLYRFVVSKDYLPFRFLRDFKMTFETANYLFVVFILVLMVFVVV